MTLERVVWAWACAVYPGWFLNRYGDDLRETLRTAARERRAGRLLWLTCQLGDVTASALRVRWSGPAETRPGDRASLAADAARDIRHAVRQTVRRPGFAILATATLGIGVGANAAIFSVVDAVLFRPLPYREPERIVRVWEGRWFSGAAYDRITDTLGSVSPLAARTRRRAILETVDAGGRELPALAVTPNFFDVVGVAAARGRVFTDGDARPGAEPVALVDHETWMTTFSGSPDIVGKAVALSGSGAVRRTIIGVLPPQFECPDFRCAVVVPLVLDRSDAHSYSDNLFLRLVGRLAAGVEADAASAEVRAFARREQQAGVLGIDSAAVAAAGVEPLLDAVVGPYRARLALLFGAVALVLLISCVNVAHLLLARATARQREWAIRGALGARRSRLMRQSLCESLLIGALGGAAALAIASAGLGVLRHALPADLPRSSGIDVDWRVFAFAFAISLSASVAMSLWPAWRVASAAGGLGPTGIVSPNRGHRRLNDGLVAGEVALAVVLMAGAGLMVRTMQSMYAVDPGFDTSGVLTLRVSPSPSRHEEGEGVVAFYDALRARVAALDGVADVGAITRLPMTPGNTGVALLPFGTPKPSDGTRPMANYRSVTPGYFAALGVRVRGRDVAPTDTSEAPGVGIVNASAAKLLWPDQDPLGQQIAGDEPGDVWFTVIGVVPDIRQHSLDARPRPEVYVPHAQDPSRELFMAVRTAPGVAPESLGVAVRDLVRGLDAGALLADVRPLSDVIAASLARTRFIASLLGVFGAVSLALGAIGVYGVTARAVASRAREIGLRVAIGASRGRVIGHIVADGSRPVLAGMLAGLPLAFLAGRALESQLFGVRPADPATIGVVVALLATTALLATAAPAVRASAVDPAEVLRGD